MMIEELKAIQYALKTQIWYYERRIIQMDAPLSQEEVNRYNHSLKALAQIEKQLEQRPYYMTPGDMDE